MKNKKIIIIFTILLVIILIGGIWGIKYVKNKNQETIIEEYTPEEEITSEQSRQTIVSLYFQEKESKQLVPEARLVDIKELINNPYEKMMNLLIEGPKNDKLEKNIPEGTKILRIYMENDCLVIDVSSEFLNYDKNDKKLKDNMVKSIVNTMTELTEVNQVKILINGNENEEFKEVYKRN